MLVGGGSGAAWENNSFSIRILLGASNFLVFVEPSSCSNGESDGDIVAHNDMDEGLNTVLMERHRRAVPDSEPQPGSSGPDRVKNLPVHAQLSLCHLPKPRRGVESIYLVDERPNEHSSWESTCIMSQTPRPHLIARWLFETTGATAFEVSVFPREMRGHVTHPLLGCSLDDVSLWACPSNTNARSTLLAWPFFSPQCQASSFDLDPGTYFKRP